MPGPPYATNSELYADPNLTEGIDWARRFRRHERFDDSPARTAEGPRTVVLAPHGGGIERGTSELCLAVAGHHPANLPITPPAGVTYDYWMFEGIRETGNAPLHVTSTGCDDGVAVSLCAGSLNALSLHGFNPAPEFPPDEQVVLVGGGNTALKGFLLKGLRDDADIKALAAGTGGELDGDNPCNIVNRTLLVGDPPWPLGGAQLELSTPLRDAMFTENTRPRRKHTTTQLFWTFVAVCRDVIDRLEAEQLAVRPSLRCPER
jgi:phage replication-related protein YjqB (UPF0714/DUF867 family)